MFPLLDQVKPSSNQVNLASCCVMPPDLTAFAKEFDIQLLTHNDPKGERIFFPLPVRWVCLIFVINPDLHFIMIVQNGKFLNAKMFIESVSQMKCSQCLVKH